MAARVAAAQVAPGTDGPPPEAAATAGFVACRQPAPAHTGSTARHELALNIVFDLLPKL